MAKALIFFGGWAGHSPKEMAGIFDNLLQTAGFTTTVSDSLDVLDDAESLVHFDLIVPCWTMGEITKEQVTNLCSAVNAGTGIAGTHGGMCDSFRESAEYQFMTGGQWVAHPGNDGVRYVVRIVDNENEITAGLSDFEVISEQYYMHTDPSNHVLAVTEFPATDVDGPHVPNGKFDMPVAWTRMYGSGRVFYSSIGHNPVALTIPIHLEMVRRGLIWAAR